MTEALLMIGHGSRAEEANAGMFSVAAGIREAGEVPIVECGFLQLNSPTIEEAFDRCVEQGAERVLMIPYFLHMGVHIREDIPAVVESCREKYPQVEILLGDQLGGDPLLARIVLNRFREMREAGMEGEIS
ncbi:MAG: sirohydrochlorin cobaltochelatase [Deltaproteobacteria bacterium]|nr:sirohydrochlorin cobaltochelatase [Deltaproteobacteria bacterium]